MARSIAHQADKGDKLILLGRDIDDINDIASDVSLQRGAEVHPLKLDMSDRDSYQKVLTSCLETLGSIDSVFFCHGVMHSQEDAADDEAAAALMLDINYTATVLFSNLILKSMLARGEGNLCYLSSVAGDRGRQSNFIYGSSKAALNTYVEGLQHRLRNTGVHALLVKPGFVDTGMTWGLPGLFLVASPDKVASDIWKAVRRKKYIIYTPWFWRIIMLIIKMVPRFIFHRSKL